MPPHIAAHRAQHRPANPPGHWESWCAYLNTELDRRAGQLGEYPELVVVIDALSELLGEHPALAAIVQRVVDEGPGRGVRLIASSTQPAAVFAAADRQQGTLRGDAVIALRTATSQDSMDLLGVSPTPGISLKPLAMPTSGRPPAPLRARSAYSTARVSPGDLVERLVTA